MSARNPIADPLEHLRELKEYMRYLYEEEERRAQRFHGATQTYLLFIGSTFAGTLAGLKWLEIRPNAGLPPSMSLRERLLLSLVLLSLLSLLISLLLTILVIKVWSKERLCNPRAFLLTASATPSRQDLLERIIANFVVAVDRNCRINNRRGQLLAAASHAYRIGLALLALAGITFALR